MTRDEVEDPQALNLWLRVNGQVKQEGNTSDMIHPVDAIIEWASRGMTLLPAAMIATGNRMVWASPAHRPSSSSRAT